MTVIFSTLTALVFLGELGAETFIECKRTAGSVHALMEFVGGAEKEKKTKTD